MNRPDRDRHPPARDLARMPGRRRAPLWHVVLSLAALFGTAVVGHGQSQLATMDDLRELEDQLNALGEQLHAQMPDVVLGMEAFREILETGRYLVGPGDQFVLLIPGLEAPVSLPVTAEGGLLIPRVGRVQVGGLRLAAAREAILDACRTQLRSGEISLELAQLRTFPVSVTGLVNEPGVSIASGVERVSEVIRKAGGLTGGASRRGIRLIRGGRLQGDERGRIQTYLESMEQPHKDSLEVLRIDLTLFRTTGLTRHNPFVEDGDLIVVPSRGGTILSREAWRRPGSYEHAPGDRISDLAALSLGPMPNHDPENVFLFRYLDGRWQSPQRVDLAAALAGDPDADLLLQPADWLVARSLPDYQHYSTVLAVGEVVYPGSYVVDEEGSYLKDVLDQAGGLTESASLAQARVIRDVDAAQVNDPEMNRIMAIPPVSWDREEKQYFNMKSREKQGQMVVDFIELFGDGEAEQNILLHPGDAIIVPRSPETVLVSGQAANPGAIPYVESYSVFDYIARAGGLGWRASSDVVVIQARTGVRRDADDVDFLEPGDRIWIKEKPVRDHWAIFTQSMQVTGQVATVVLLFVTILK